MSQVPARRSRVEAQRETRERLLDAAAVEFAEQGFHGASIDAITARAGFTRGAFYSNFDHKADLLVELTERRVGAFLEDQLGRLLATPPGERANALAHWLVTEDEPTEVLLLAELARIAPSVPEANEALEGVLTTIAGAVAAALARADEVDAAERRPRTSTDDVVAALVIATLGARVLRAMRGTLDAAPVALLLDAVLDADRAPVGGGR